MLLKKVVANKQGEKEVKKRPNKGQKRIR